MSTDKLSEVWLTVQEHTSAIWAINSRLDEWEAQRIQDREIAETREKALQARLNEIVDMLERRNECH